MPITKKKLDSIIRVNHAGEYGAIRIYAGQLAALGKKHKDYNLIKEMYEGEQEHLEYFEAQIRKNRTRPTLLMPVWHVLGYALGFGTGLLGKKAAMTCTHAVESVIETHYAQQEEILKDYTNDDLKEKISAFKEDEIHHKDIGLENGLESSIRHSVLYNAVKIFTKVAIGLSKKI